MIKITIPGNEVMELHSLILDMNGTLTIDGILPEGVSERIQQLKNKLKIYLLTADTFGTGARVAEELGIEIFMVSPENGNADKAHFASALDADGVAAIGNGKNDLDMIKLVRLSIVIIGTEGCSVATLLQSDIAVTNINDGLDLLLNPLRIVATLRA